MTSYKSNTRLNQKYILALHSCTDYFGVAIFNYLNPKENIQHKLFPVGRKLANEIFKCVEKILPQEYWHQIIRIAVAIGPGSYTGTRISVAMARTLAQQLECSLDSLSTFKLMASRLFRDLEDKNMYDPFWIKNPKNRRGIIAGKYKVINESGKPLISNIIEIKKPSLFENNSHLYPSILANEQVEKDLLSLLQFSIYCQEIGIKNHWGKVLPIYPTSPVDNYK